MRLRASVRITRRPRPVVTGRHRRPDAVLGAYRRAVARRSLPTQRKARSGT